MFKMCYITPHTHSKFPQNGQPFAREGNHIVPRIMDLSNNVPVDQGREARIGNLLAEYASILHTVNDPALLINYGLQTLLELVSARTGSFFLWNDQERELELKAVFGAHTDGMQGLKKKLNEGITGWVAERRASLLVKDINSDERIQDLKQVGIRSYNSISFLSLPLVANSRLVGVVNITDKTVALPFSSSDLEIAQAFVKHMAIAYEQLRGFQALAEENRNLREELARMKTRVQEQASLATTGKLASHIAHDLGNPIDAIRRYLNLSLDHIPEDSPAREYLAKAKQGIKRAIRIIKGLLTYSKTTHESRRGKVEVHALLDQCLNYFMSHPDFLRITFEVQYHPQQIHIDAVGLETIFQNIIQNGIDAIQGPGTIRVTTGVSNGRVDICFTDSGAGIPEALKPQIFVPFFTTKTHASGTGIGLALCKEIAEMNGGSVSFESKEREGTVFTVSFPCAPEEVPA